MSSERFKPFLAVYLIFRDQDKVLLSRRFNTGYMDGYYSLVAGHVDEGESITGAVIREAKEEANVDIKSEGLKLVYTLHRKYPGRVYVDLFFEVRKWSGDLLNAEPEKCDDLSWFDSTNLPENTIEYVRFALEEIQENRNFGVLGWE